MNSIPRRRNRSSAPRNGGGVRNEPLTDSPIKSLDVIDRHAFAIRRFVEREAVHKINVVQAAFLIMICHRHQSFGIAVITRSCVAHSIATAHLISANARAWRYIVTCQFPCRLTDGPSMIVPRRKHF